ncbi:hypothetical protein ACTJJE_13250 [Mycolicibacterium sp. 22603]
MAVRIQSDRCAVVQARFAPAAAPRCVDPSGIAQALDVEATVLDVM